MNTYTTKDITDKVGIHVNTVGFYEQIGIVTSRNAEKMNIELQNIRNTLRTFTEKAAIIANQ